MSQSIYCNVPEIFFLIEHPKGNWTLERCSKGARSALEGNGGAWALKGHLGTRALGHSRHLCTRALKGHLDPQPLRHSKTWALEAFETLEALYLEDSTLCITLYAFSFYMYPPKLFYFQDNLISLHLFCKWFCTGKELVLIKRGQTCRKMFSLKGYQ